MKIPMPLGSPLWIAAGWTMFHFYWVGAAIGLSGLLGRRALRGVRPEARYALALTILAAMTVAPAGILAWIYERRTGRPRAYVEALAALAGAPAPCRSN
jgi:hypothetical protein